MQTTAKSIEAYLEEIPEDRKLLAKLRKLYTREYSEWIC
jgi:hypothetical protein